MQPWVVIGDGADEGGLQAGVFVDGVAEAVDGGEVEVAIAINPFIELMPGGENVGDFEKPLTTCGSLSSWMTIAW